MGIARRIRCCIAAVFFSCLGGCIAQPKHLAYNHESNKNTKQIAVLKMRHSDIDLLIVNNVGYSFGLIGVAIAEANRAPKAHWLRDQTARDHLDYLTEFHDALTTAMANRGYDLRWSDPMQVPEHGDDVPRESYGLRKSYGPQDDGSAQLDVEFGFIGYAAAGSGDSAPYRPTVVLTARLVSPDGKRVLFEDLIVYNNVFSNIGNPITVEPDETYRYPEFDALSRAGSTATEGLKVAFRAAANELAKQF